MADTPFPMPAPRGEDRWLADALAAFPHPPEDVLVGPGHDAAVLDVGGTPLVVAKDVLVDGVHFEGGEHAPARIAHKALAVNLSDLAATGARPVGFLVGGVLPAPADRAAFDALMAGFAAAATRFGVPCLGGDTNVAPGPLTLSVTVLGRAGPHGLVSRRGAKVGDRLSVTGPLGGSRAGRHLDVVPRLAEAAALLAHVRPHAMMDLSDGLARDLPRLCRASEVGAVVETRRLPIHADVPGGAPDIRIAAALGDGEDFELLLAHVPPDAAAQIALGEAGVALVEIGRVVADEEGLCLLGPDGPAPWPVLGHDHVDRAGAGAP